MCRWWYFISFVNLVFPQVSYVSLILESIQHSYGTDSLEHRIWTGVVRGKVVEGDLNDDRDMILTAIHDAIVPALAHIQQQEVPSFLQLYDTIQFGIKSGDGTPCQTQEECDRLASMMSACSKVREIGYSVYATIQGVTNVLSTTMTILCACLFTGPVHYCILGNFPYTCTMPYQLYGKIIGMGSSIWEANRVLSTMCNMMIDPSMMIPLSD